MGEMSATRNVGPLNANRFSRLDKYTIICKRLYECAAKRNKRQ